MPYELRNRIIRPAKPRERERHAQIRREIQEELPELKRWAREVAARHQDEVVVGAVLRPEEKQVLAAMDE